MKILKRPKILPCECKICGAIFQPKWRNLEKSSRLIKESVYCPLCKTKNFVKFEKGATDESKTENNV